MGIQDVEMSQEYKKDLLDILYLRSFIFDPEKGFTLSSGKKSDVYIDARRTTLSAEGMELVGFAFFQEVKLEPIDAIGGLTMGADPIAMATALVSTMNNKFLDAFVIRKEPKKHGTMQWIEGNVKPGADVAIVDDVVTTGESIITAVQKAREAGLNVRKVYALVDRQEGGSENVKAKTGLELISLYTKTDLLEFHRQMVKEKGNPVKTKPFEVIGKSR